MENEGDPICADPTHPLATPTLSVTNVHAPSRHCSSRVQVLVQAIIYYSSDMCQRAECSFIGRRKKKNSGTRGARPILVGRPMLVAAASRSRLQFRRRNCSDMLSNNAVTIEYEACLRSCFVEHVSCTCGLGCIPSRSWRRVRACESLVQTDALALVARSDSDWSFL